MKASITIDEMLLAKFFAGEATPEEALAVDAWLSDPENKRNWQALEKTWNLGAEVGKHRLPNVDHEWQRIKGLVRTNEKGKVRTFFRPPLAIAASLLALAVLSALLWFKLRQNPQQKEEQYAVISADQVLTDSLADGSVVTLNRHSRFTYDKNFGTDHRDVVLQGEAYFQVQPDRNKPFIIHLDRLSIQVVGTAFNVKQSADSSQVVVQVNSGIVKMFTSEKDILVTKGQTGIYSKAGERLEVMDSVSNNSMSYATKNFDFQDMRLSEIIGVLEDAFGVSIKTEDPRLLNCRLTAQFENKTLDYIMDIIAATLNLTYSKKGDVLFLSGEGCY
jgi:ferric-dicitrate binding protein FerR (iron transport regulator)